MVRLLVDAKAQLNFQLDDARRFAPQSLNQCQVCFFIYFREATALQCAIDTDQMEIAEFLQCSGSFGHAAAPVVAFKEAASD